MLKHFSRNFFFFFFQIFELRYIFENFGQKVPKKCQKKWFFGKKSCFLTFLVKIYENIA